MLDAYRLHVVLEATDAGSPRLTRYRRAIIEMPTGGRPTKGKTCPRIAVSLQPADVNFDTGTFPTTAAFSTDSDIGALLDHPAARAVLERLAPEVVAGASSNAMVRNMTLRSLRSLDPRMTEERLTAIDVELAKVAPK